MSGTATANPNIPQGTLNRVRGNVQIPGFPGLNVTASFLGEGGFAMTPTGPVTTMINTMTGRVPSPEVFQPYNIEIHLVKSMSLAAAWEAQRVSLSVIGSILVYTDSMTLPAYAFQQVAIENIGALTENGKSVEYMVTLTGTYIINNQLWALTI